MDAPSRLTGIVQESRQDFRRLLPFLRRSTQTPLPCLRQLIELCAPIVFGTSPPRPDMAFLFKLQKRWIERAVVQDENVAAGLFNAPRKTIPMLRPHRLQRPQDHKSQRALPNVGFVIHQRNSSWKPIEAIYTATY